MVALVTPEEILKAQESASKTRLGICVGVVFLHGMQLGASVSMEALSFLTICSLLLPLASFILNKTRPAGSTQ